MSKPDWLRPRDVVAELVAAKAIFDLRGGVIELRPNGKKWDFVNHLRVSVKYEHKTDWKESLTGNCYFELRNTHRNEPSGLAATEADWWVHILPGRNMLLLFDPTEMLNHLASNKGAPGYQETQLNGGDNNSQGIKVRTRLVLQLPFVQKYPLPVDLQELFGEEASRLDNPEVPEGYLFPVNH